MVAAPLKAASTHKERVQPNSKCFDIDNAFVFRPSNTDGLSCEQPSLQPGTGAPVLLGLNSGLKNAGCRWIFVAFAVTKKDLPPMIRAARIIGD
jgi:hypothetical protein